MTAPAPDPSLWARLGVPLAAALTLGLAPFAPEPHIVGKLRWIAGGAVGMSSMDWFDVAVHGLPWLWLAGTAAELLWTRLRRAPAPDR